jgi:hypothetical protein
MGWVERCTEGLQEHFRFKRIVTGVLIGGTLTVGVGWSMYSDTLHQLTGRPSTATLIEHVRECTVKYQIVGEDRRQEPMACDAAEAFQQRVGPSKAKVSAERFALVRFSLADGRTHEAKVDERTLHSHGLPVGATFPVVYDPDQPADVRPVLTWDHLKVSLMLFALGAVSLMLAFPGPIAALFAWAFRRGPAPVDNAPRPAAVVSGRDALPTMRSKPRASFGMRK